jgi:hemerythrin superfamily protein
MNGGGSGHWSVLLQTRELPVTRSIAHQTVDELGGPGSVLVRQRNDHVELDRLLHELDGTTGTAQEQVLRRIDRLVFSHAFAEEAVLWPAIRRVLPEGEALTVEIEREHQEINEVITALERSRRGDADREALLERAITLLDHDVRDEEDELFPRLRDALDDHDLRRLGRSWELVRRTAPTRGHPVVARRPPGNVVAALPLTLLDRSHDGLDALSRRAPGPVATGTRALSRALAAVAGAVEHLPPMRRGEDPSTHSGRTELED